MNYTSDYDSDHSGPDSSATTFTGVFTHVLSDNATKVGVNPHFLEPRYNAHLRPDDDNNTDEETDRSSQSSSDEYFSQVSEAPTLTSPSSDASDDQECSLRAVQTEAKHSLIQHTSHKLSECQELRYRPTKNVSLRDNPSITNIVGPESTRQAPCAKNVVFRPKPMQVSLAPIELPSGLQLDTSRSAEDVQRSRMRPEPLVHPADLSSSCARRRTDRSNAVPPKLRRDTDQTDVVVKMIVLFCTNLINSIWTAGATLDTTSQQSGSNVLPLQVFITETLRRSKTSYSTLQIALYYLILLKQTLPSSGLARQASQGCRAMQCGRRMFLTALILASKYLQDRNYSARAWSKISGLPLKEINENERRYLSIVSWDLHVPKDTFENWSKIVLNVCRLSSDSDSCGRDFDTQPPPPGSGPSRQTVVGKTTCQDTVAAMRSWWLGSLKSLCTDIVKCPRRTDKYVCGIAPFRNALTLPRPVSEVPWYTVGNGTETEHENSMKTLTRLPSLESMARTFFLPETKSSPAMTATTPTTTRMLANLPTPQQTPHAPDMTSMWTPQPSSRGLRCKMSASALASLDQRRCPMASLNTCPPPPPKAPASRTWTAWRHPTPNTIPDRSLTSSPDSVLSDTSSVFSHAAWSRSRSSSMSSTKSWMTTDSTLSTCAERSGDVLASRHALEDVQMSNLPFASSHIAEGLASMNVMAPRTVRDDNLLAAKTTLPESVTQKPAALSEHILTGGSPCGTSFLSVCPSRSGSSTKGTQLSCIRHLTLTPESSRPRLRRPVTQIFEPSLRSLPGSHSLKRSRSEFLDINNEQREWSASLSWYSTLSMESIKSTSVNTTRPGLAVNELEKKTIIPSRDCAASTMAVMSGERTNKRRALQPSISPAVSLATTHLRREVCTSAEFQSLGAVG